MILRQLVEQRIWWKFFLLHHLQCSLFEDVSRFYEYDHRTGLMIRIKKKVVMKGEQLNVNKSTKKIKTNAKHKKWNQKIMANGTSF